METYLSNLSLALSNINRGGARDCITEYLV